MQQILTGSSAEADSTMLLDMVRPPRRDGSMVVSVFIANVLTCARQVITTLFLVRFKFESIEFESGGRYQINLQPKA